MLTVVCENTRILWVFPTASKISPVRIICFFLTILKNEKYSCRRFRVEEDRSLVNSKVVSNLIVDKFRISMRNIGGDASWINVKNELHNRSIQNMVRSGLIESN